MRLYYIAKLRIKTSLHADKFPKRERVSLLKSKEKRMKELILTIDNDYEIDNESTFSIDFEYISFSHSLLS